MKSPLDLLNEIQSIDLSKVETSFPILATGNVIFTISDAKITASDEKPESPFFEITYDMAQEWRTQPVDGIASKVVPIGGRGAKMTERIYFGYYEDKKTGEEKTYGIERYAQLREAALGKAEDGAKINPPELIGQTVTLKLHFNPAPRNKDTGEVYGPRTEILGYVRKAKSA